MGGGGSGGNHEDGEGVFTPDWAGVGLGAGVSTPATTASEAASTSSAAGATAGAKKKKKGMFKGVSKMFKGVFSSGKKR